ncbi:MAG: [protein-PII] uridylyltransferase [Deltaproteobacteria bacterium]|nr:MAG: [protein-PII] uridylyltransferase [Deltaproteobacteria bacterium]
MENAARKLEINRNELIKSSQEKFGTDFLKWHTQILDAYFRNSIKESTACSKFRREKNAFSVVALGGYGRSEQCLFSDIDILFLFQDRVPVEAEGIIRDVVYPLWDLKFEVGHATRSVRECISLASADFQILTSLIDARLIGGSEDLFRTLKEILYKKVIHKKKKQIMHWLSDNDKKRHALFGDSAYLLEPNIKEGVGGLRDYHSMLWRVNVVNGLENQGELGNRFQLPEDEYQILHNSIVFMWGVRNKLHHLAGKKCDRLYFEFHQDLANRFITQPGDGLHTVEQFLGEFHKKVEIVKHQSMLFLSELQGGISVSIKSRFFGKQTKVKGLIIRKNMLDFASMEECIKDPTLLIKIYMESIDLNLSVCREAKRVEKRLSYLIDDDFRKSEAVISALEDILGSLDDKNSMLDAMLFSGLLVNLIPEFKGVEHRIEYDEYHSYPVDKHLLLTVKTLNSLGRKKLEGDTDLYYQLYLEIKDIRLLQWAALLHDIGKTRQCTDHSKNGAGLAESIMKRFGYGEGEISSISFLIQEHLLLKTTAMKRDLNDEQTAISCAATIKDVDRLKMLYLLTVADCMSTGSKAWTSWISILIRDLFFRVLHVLEKGELATEQIVKKIEMKKEVLHRFSISGENHEESVLLVNSLSPRYLLAVDEKDIMDHIRLYQTLGEKKLVWSVAKEKESEIRTVTVCAKNQPGLLSKITGIFSLHNLNVLDVGAFTWRNNIALDIFQVTAPKDRLFEEKIWKGAEKILEDSLEGAFDIAAAIRKKFKTEQPFFTIPPHKGSMVYVDNQTSSYFIIIEVYTYDFPGLLFWITDTIFNHGYDIMVCKAATKADQVVDVFYIRDFDGGKPEMNKKFTQLKNAIEQIVKVDHYGKSKMN